VILTGIAKSYKGIDKKVWDSEDTEDSSHTNMGIICTESLTGVVNSNISRNGCEMWGAEQVQSDGKE
jgi:hypothetical protein